jgi:hypothetical protein
MSRAIVLLSCVMFMALFSLNAMAAEQRMVDELREQAAAAAREADELQKQGREDAAATGRRRAEVLERHAQEFVKQIEERNKAREQGDRNGREFETRIRAMKEKIERLRQDGQPDKAEQVQAELNEVLARSKGERPEIERREFETRIRALKEKIERLRQEGQPDKAELVQADLNEVIARSNAERSENGRRPEMPGSGQDARNEAQKKASHLRTAAENLHAVGMHDQADKLMREAEQLQRSTQSDGGPGDLPRQVQELRERVDDLCRRLSKLEQVVDQLARRGEERGR